MGTQLALEFYPAKTHHITDHRLIQKLHNQLQTLGPDDVIAFDLETTDLNPRRPWSRVVCAALTFLEDGEVTTTVVGLSHPDCAGYRHWRQSLALLCDLLLECPAGLVAHNASFDLGYVKVMTGQDLWPKLVGDTALSSHLLDENKSAALKFRARDELGAPNWADFDWKALELEYKLAPAGDERRLAERVPWYQMARYVGADTFWTWHLHQLHADWLSPDEHDPDAREMYRLGQYYKTVGMRTIGVLAQIEQTGFMLDRNFCVTQIPQLEKLIADCLSKLDELGIPDVPGYEKSYEPTSKYFQAWAEMQCKAGKLRVIARTKTSVPSWSKDILDKLSRDGYEAAQVLRDMRVASRELTFLRGWLDVAEADGRIHCNYHYDSVVTGRLSSSGPNLQQIPRSLKKAFRAAPGHVLVSADYAGVEMRVAAHEADCKPLKQAFLDGFNVHEYAASLTLGVPLEQVTKDDKQKAKARNFGFLFGMWPKKFIKYAEDNYGVIVTEEEAEEARADFFSTWEGLAQWHARVENHAMRYGQITSALGRIRRVPAATYGDDFQRARAARQAINSPVQGFASDMMCLATHRIREAGIKVVAIVHDCVVCEVPSYETDYAARTIKYAMETGVLDDLKELGCEFSVPLVAEVSVSVNWTG